MWHLYGFTGGKEEKFKIENDERKGRAEVSIRMQCLQNRRETGLGISEHRGQKKCQAAFQGSTKNDMDLFNYVCFFEM